MGIKLKSGKTVKDDNKEARSSIYGHMGRANIHFFNEWAELCVDVYPDKDIKDLSDVTNRIKTITLQIQGEDFVTYIKPILDQLYAAMNELEDGIDSEKYESDE